MGGLAVQYWGEPRLTRDVDVTAAVPLDGTEDFVRLIMSHFVSRVEDAVSFARQTRMILVKASNGCEIDISMSIPDYEDEVIRRAIDYELEQGKRVQLCSAEDLIIHKAVAGRPRDIEDIEGIVYRQGNSLDVEYIRLWLREFAAALENPELSNRFKVPWRRLHAKSE
jgi:hypothetical protein